MIVIVEAHYDMQCGDCEDAVNEALTDNHKRMLRSRRQKNSALPVLPANIQPDDK